MVSNDDQVADGEDLASNRSKILNTVESNPNAYSSWTDDQDQELLELVKSGMDWPAISERLGRTSGAIKRQASRLAFEEVHGRLIPDKRDSVPGQQQPWTPEDLAKLAELIPTAESWEEIGEFLGRAPAKCRRRAESDALDSLTP